MNALCVICCARAPGRKWCNRSGLTNGGVAKPKSRARQIVRTISPLSHVSMLAIDYILRVFPIREW